MKFDPRDWVIAAVMCVVTGFACHYFQTEPEACKCDCDAVAGALRDVEKKQDHLIGLFKHDPHGSVGAEGP